MADIGHHEKELIFLRKLAANAPSSMRTSVDIAKTLAFENSSASVEASRYSMHQKSKSFIAVDFDTSLEGLESKIVVLEQLLRVLEERRNEQNYNTLVSLDDNIVQVLETFNIL